LFERRRYALPHAPVVTPESTANAEAAMLEAVLRPARTLEVRSPFPVDPRTVAAAITRAL
jgi:hypothetical protein